MTPQAERPGRRRPGSILPLVLVALTVAGILGLAFVGRAVRGRSTGAWSGDHAAMRMLADSATEEAWAIMQEVVNDPASPAFRKLRMLPVGPLPEPAVFEGITLKRLPAEVTSFEGFLGARIVVAAAVGVREVQATGSDPLEKVGLATFDASVTLTRPGRPTVTEKVRVEREFRLARVTPPRPLDRAGIFIRRTTAKDLSRFSGRMALAPASGSPHKLLDLLTEKSRDGFLQVPRGAARWIRWSLEDLAPAEMAIRAHLVLDTPDQYLRLLQDRLGAGGALSGVIHARFTDPVTLEFPRFRGRCLLSFSGPVTVKEIVMADDETDTLTVVTSDRIMVEGPRVEASLINPSEREDGVTFLARTSVLGCVASGRFLRSSRITPAQLGDCLFAADPRLHSGTSTEAEPDDRLLSQYLALFSPWPRATQHTREGDAWVDW